MCGIGLEFVVCLSGSCDALFFFSVIVPWVVQGQLTESLRRAGLGRAVRASQDSKGFWDALIFGRNCCVSFGFGPRILRLGDDPDF
jgi:hypothetical protein